MLAHLIIFSVICLFNCDKALLQITENDGNYLLDPNQPVLRLATDPDELEIVKLVFQNASNVNLIDNFNNTFLHTSIIRGYDLLIIKFLHQKGANLNATNINEDTPLRLAKVLQPSRSDIANYLTENGAKDSGRTPDFLRACKDFNFNLIKYLHEVRAVDINEIDIYRKQNALFEIIGVYTSKEAERFEIVKYLVNIGVNIHVVNDEKSTLLTKAVDDNQINVAKYLVDQGIDVKKIDNTKNSALHYAAFGKHYYTSSHHFEMVKYFVNLGLDVKSKNYYGETPLSYAVRGYCDLKLAKYLVESGSPAKEKDNSGKTAQDYAKEKGKVDIYRYLEALKNDSILQAQVDTNALFFAAAQNNIQAVELYLAKNISVNVQDENDGETPLYRAIYFKGQLDMVRLLHLKGADFELFDPAKMENLVYLSIIKNKLDVVEYLIDNGADYKTAGISGNTPMDAALETDSINLVKYLLDKIYYNHTEEVVECRKVKVLKPGSAHLSDFFNVPVRNLIKTPIQIN